jgi:hypothetical protein
VTADSYSLAEEVFLAHPLPVTGGLYHVALDDLVGGAEWRDAREQQYVDLLRELRANDPETARRTVRRDRALDLLIERRVRGLVALIEREVSP